MQDKDIRVVIGGTAAGLEAATARGVAALNGLQRSGGSAQAQAAGMMTAYRRLTSTMPPLQTRITALGGGIRGLSASMASGAQASTALGQQLGIVLSAFGPLGVAAGVLAATTMPALAEGFGSASNTADGFTSAMEQTRAGIERLQGVHKILSTSMDDLILKYGEGTSRVLQFAVAHAELEVAMAARQMRASVDLLGSVTRQYTAATEAGRNWQNTLNRIEREFGLSNTQAAEFSRLLQDIGNDTSIEGQSDALQRILNFLKANNVELSRIPPELQRALSDMIALANETEVAETAMRKLAAAAASVSLPVTTGDPRALAGLTGDQLLPPPSRGEGDAPRRSGGGGGGGARANPIVAQLESLRASLMTQEEAQIASFQRQQETLQAALEQRLLTQTEHLRLMEQAQQQHADRMSQIDVYRYGTGLQQAQAFMGGMASALQSGNERMAAIGKKFAAVEALINAWRAHNQVLADPSVPFFAKIPAALAVLSAGVGAVSAIRGDGGGGGGRRNAAQAAATAAPAPSTYVNVSLVGGSNYGPAQMREFGEMLNRFIEQGGVIRGIRFT
jgi:hypothetical protein